MYSQPIRTAESICHIYHPYFLSQLFKTPELTESPANPALDCDFSPSLAPVALTQPPQSPYHSLPSGVVLSCRLVEKLTPPASVAFTEILKYGQVAQVN
jgi:hypothetical protein